MMPPISALAHPLFPRLSFHPVSVGWVAPPDTNTRGTWTILQSCVVTIFFCTATSLHLNIPKERYGDWRRVWTRFWWMTANTVAPEILMCVAMTQYLEARILLRDINELCDQYRIDNPEWTIMHAFYFNMGSFIFHPHSRRGRSRGNSSGGGSSSSSSSHSYRGHSRHHRKPKTLKMKHIDEVVKQGLLREVTIPLNKIKEYSKQDRLGKTIALAQALWLLVQTFARMAAHLPTSPLEITCVAYVVCTLFSWSLWFNKPQDVGFSNDIKDDRFANVIRNTKRNNNNNHRSHHHDDSNTRDSENENDNENKPHKSGGGWKNQLPNMNRKYRLRDKLYLGITWTFTAAVFGGLHLLAWNYEFPSAEEKALWRFSSLAIMALPPIFYIWFAFHYVALGGRSRTMDPIGLVITLVYVAARIYNLLEVFFSLRSAPPMLYTTIVWTNLLPHF